MKTISTLLLSISMLGIVHAQNVGVGTSSPSSRFEIKGIQNEKIFDARNYLDESKLIIDKDGNVGIGESNPLTKLHINSTDAVIMPKGTSLERPASPQEGSTRYNSDSKALEYYDGTQWVSTNTEQVSVGTITPYGGNTAPAGWLICNGSAVSRTTYAELFAILGTTYGVGDGSTTFNLPDLRGKVAYGLSTSAPFNNLGATGGNTSVTPTLTPNLSVDIASFNTVLPDHKHPVPAHSHGHSLTTAQNTTSSNGAHTHYVNGFLLVGDNNGSLPWYNWSNAAKATSINTTSSDGAHTHTIPALSVTGTVGTGTSGNVPFDSGNPTSNPNIAIDPPSTAVTGSVTSSDINTTNPYQVVNYIIKADNTLSPNVIAVNIPTGTVGQTLYNNGSGWQATNNVYNNGTNVGIGTTSPTGALSVGSGNPFQVSNSGAITATGIVSSGTVAFSGLNVNNGIVRTNSSGELSSSILTVADIPAGSVTADNGLTINSANNVRLGGTLTAATDIELNSNNFTFSGSGNIGIGNSPNASAILDISSTTKGFAMPSMTSAQRKAISSPLDGLQVYDTDLKGYYYWNGSKWDCVSAPAGTVNFFGGSTAPSGYLVCNGTAVSRTTYAELFSAIGTTYGTGNGSTTFNLPDLRGEFVRGTDGGRGVDAGRANGSAQAQDWKGFSMTNTGQNTFAYSHGPVYMGKNVTPAAFVGNLFTGGWAAPSAAIGTQWDASEIRPRNVALLPCIKF